MLSGCKSLGFKAGSSGGQYSLLLFFFFVKSTDRNSMEGTKESSPYRNPQKKIHMPIIFTWHGNLRVNSIILAFNEGSLCSDGLGVQQFGDICPPSSELRSTTESQSGVSQASCYFRIRKYLSSAAYRQRIHHEPTWKFQSERQS